METGEYFLNEKEVQERAMDIKKKRQEKKLREKEDRELEVVNEDAELRREKEAERKKGKQVKKAEEPFIEELQNKFLTKPLKKIQF